MGVVAGILAVLAGIGVLLWRIQVASDAARGAVDAASDAHSLYRRFLWGRKASRSPIDLVEDPREAAAAMMVALAQYDGALTSDEQQLIVSEMQTAFDASQKDADELLARGRWLVRDIGDLDGALKRLLPPVQKRLGDAEKRQLVEMLRTVVGPSPGRDSVPHEAVQRVDERLFPRN